MQKKGFITSCLSGLLSSPCTYRTYRMASRSLPGSGSTHGLLTLVVGKLHMCRGCPGEGTSSTVKAFTLSVSYKNSSHPAPVVHFWPPPHSSCHSRHRPVRRLRPIFTLPTLIKCFAHILTPAVLDRHHLCSVGRSRSSSCHHFFQHVFLNNLRAGGVGNFSPRRFGD